MLIPYAEKKTDLRQPGVNQFVDHFWEKPGWSATPWLWTGIKKSTIYFIMCFLNLYYDCKIG